MHKNYKTVVLKYMFLRSPGEWYKSVTAMEAALFFHAYLMEKPYGRDADLADQRGKSLHVYDEMKVARLIAEMPMTKWRVLRRGRLLLRLGNFI
ncbi:hypothetical protein [Sporosarcina aquimarina]|nr:hypothetical protein [Sporosarcina aquimarina]MBY0223860.1 hypothetical protein [Sporosarcina aquimarina]